MPGLKGTVGQELLKAHLSYGPLVQKLIKKFNRVGKPDQVKREIGFKSVANRHRS